MKVLESELISMVLSSHDF